MNASGCSGFSQRRFALESLPREPWKNGGGWTRSVAGATDEHGRTLWRVSVAEIGTAGPFSIFEGLQRQAVMLQGARLRLRSPHPQDDVLFNGPGSLTAFPGERALVADTPTEPTQLWNLMHRRGRVNARLQVLNDQLFDLPPAPHGLVFVQRGEFELVLPRCRSLGLAPGQGMHLQQLPAGALLVPCQTGSLAVLTTVF
jgi:environmental stress-induced protein Ves